MTDTIDSQQLLAEYARNGSEAAFRELVARYINFVYSTALRLVDGNTQLAEDVAQTVFINLANKGRTLSSKVMLGGWLHQHTYHVATKAARAERRRQTREMEAVAMNTLHDDSAANLRQVDPILDEAIIQLGSEDRTAILLRFFEQRDFRSIGLALGSNEDAARMRVTRALDKLHSILKRRGTTLSVAALGTALAAGAVTAAPAGLATSIAGAALATGAAAGGISVTLLKLTALTKLQLGVISALVIASTATLFLVQNQPGKKVEGSQAADQPPGLVGATPPLANSISATNTSQPLENDQLLGSTPPRPHSSRKYILTDLGTLPGFISSRATGINNQGQIVGWADTTNDITHAFLWENGVMKDLGTSGGSESLASSINNSGDIVGAMILNGERHIVIWHDGKMADLGVLDKFARLGDSGNYNPGVGINDQSRVTSRLTVESGNQRSFIWDQGKTAYFGLLGDGSLCHAQAINNRGEIVGQAIDRSGRSYAFVWQDGKVNNLGTLGGTRADATALNDHGTVIGWSTLDGAGLDAAHAFIWKNGTMQDLGTLGGKTSRAYAMNNSGQVIGYTSTSEGHSDAFLWENNQMSNLNDLVISNSGWRLGSGDAINDRGQIVAVARKDGVRHACLLSPPNLAPFSVSRANTAPASPNIAGMSYAPLNLTSFERLPGGEFRLSFAGKPDAKYFIEVSTNLVTWTRLGPATNNNGKVDFTDAEAAKQTLRFYRAMLE
ncbi:MAG: hypothetical protein JWQ71_2470 [Pedosphaera sp.]|nr:hypothetical protein [Pedosphaera sp.]